MSAHAIFITAFDRPGMMSALTRVLADHDANITHIDIHPGSPTSGIYFEVTIPDDRSHSVLDDLKAVAGVERVEETPSSAKIYGKRIIVMGGGAGATKHVRTDHHRRPGEDRGRRSGG